MLVWLCHHGNSSPIFPFMIFHLFIIHELCIIHFHLLVMNGDDQRLEVRSRSALTLPILETIRDKKMPPLLLVYGICHRHYWSRVWYRMSVITCSGLCLGIPATLAFSLMVYVYQPLTRGVCIIPTDIIMHSIISSSLPIVESDRLLPSICGLHMWLSPKSNDI